MLPRTRMPCHLANKNLTDCYTGLMLHCPSVFCHEMWTSVRTSLTEAASSSVWTILEALTAPARRAMKLEKTTPPSASVSQTSRILYSHQEFYFIFFGKNAFIPIPQLISISFSTFPAVCDPPCQNYGVCVAPNICDCPPGYPGVGCSGTIHVTHNICNQIKMFTISFSLCLACFSV